MLDRISADERIDDRLYLLMRAFEVHFTFLIRARGCSLLMRLMDDHDDATEAADRLVAVDFCCGSGI